MCIEPHDPVEVRVSAARKIRDSSSAGSGFAAQSVPAKKDRAQSAATIKKVRVVRADTERNLLLVKGSLPGSRGSLILVKKA